MACSSRSCPSTPFLNEFDGVYIDSVSTYGATWLKKRPIDQTSDSESSSVMAASSESGCLQKATLSNLYIFFWFHSAGFSLKPRHWAGISRAAKRSSFLTKQKEKNIPKYSHMHNSTHKFDSTRMCHQPSLTSLALFFVLGAGSLTAEHVHTHTYTLWWSMSTIAQTFTQNKQVPSSLKQGTETCLDAAWVLDRKRRKHFWGSINITSKEQPSYMTSHSRGAASPVKSISLSCVGCTRGIRTANDCGSFHYMVLQFLGSTCLSSGIKGRVSRASMPDMLHGRGFFTRCFRPSLRNASMRSFSRSDVSNPNFFRSFEQTMDASFLV